MKQTPAKPPTTKPAPSTKPNITKILAKPGHRILSIDAPSDYVTLMGTLPNDATLHDKSDGDSYDLVHLFVLDKATLNKAFPKAIQALKAGGLLWVSYPKKTGSIKTDLTRDVCYEILLAKGWQAVTQVALDDTWSAMRYKPSET